jgi:1,4-alpha-glucan branching enzyme
MPGDDWQKFANLRAYFGWMWAHPGKKLMFMGGEFGQWREWNADASLDWHLLTEGANAPRHAGLQRLVRDLNLVYRHYPALHRLDVSAEGFEWIRHNDADHSVFAFQRRCDANPDDVERDGSVVIVASNFTPMPRLGWRIGVPRRGAWREIVNTDLAIYGGSGMANPPRQSDDQPCDGHRQSILVDLPPLSTVFWVLAS